MADRGPDYSVEAMRLRLQMDEHDDTIARGQARLLEIERAKKRNISRTDIANAELDSEADSIRENEKALEGRKAEITTNLSLMKKG